MKVNSLLKSIGIKPVNNNHEISFITSNSKECIPNCIFVCTVDRIDYIDEAINNGAKTIIGKIEYDYTNYILVDNPKLILGDLLFSHYKTIFNSLSIIGVIGTNGKTTTSTLINSYLNSISYKSMLIGSNGCYYDNTFIKHNNTTPDIVTLYSYFLLAFNLGMNYVVMEVSSIAISEYRIRRIPFEILIFTNFSEDHLDYHITMDNYLFNKCIPFYQLNNKSYAIVNKDDNNHHSIIKHTNANVITYSIDEDSDIKAIDIAVINNGVSFSIDNLRYDTNLLGKFNVYNILPLFAIARILKVNRYTIYDFLLEFKNVSGRMNYYKIKDKNIIIDYAHTPEAVRSVIRDINSLTNNDVYVVVGCGGNREREKRFIIGEILYEENCIPIVTSDNPRFENPLDIINDINIGGNNSLFSILDRKKAIMYALNKMKENDYLLILGKGSEDYIDIKGDKIHYSDYEVIEEYKND